MLIFSINICSCNLSRNCLILFSSFKNIIYFLFRFGLANAIKVKTLCVVCVWRCLLIKFVIQNLKHIYFCKADIFKPGFSVQNPLLNLCSCAVNSQRLFCSQKLVWNVCIKAFLYTKWFKKILCKNNLQYQLVFKKVFLFLFLTIHSKSYCK